VVNYIQKNCICPQVYSTVDTEEKNDTTRRLVIVEQRALGGVFCRMRNAESCQGVICGKLNADFFCRMKGKVWNETAECCRNEHLLNTHHKLETYKSNIPAINNMQCKHILLASKAKHFSTLQVEICGYVKAKSCPR